MPVAVRQAQHFQVRGHSFLPKRTDPENELVYFFPFLKSLLWFLVFSTHAHRARITVTVVKGRKIRTPLRSQWILQDWLPCSQKTKKHNLVNQSCFHFKTLHSAPYLSYCSFHLQIVLTSKEVFQYTTVIKVKDYNHELNGGVFANSIGLVISVN